MKRFGSTCTYTTQRNKELLLAYREVIRKVEVINLPKVLNIISDMPCSRFWVSEQRAAIILAKLFKGENILCGMRKCKQEMFMKLYLEAICLRQENQKASIFQIAWQVVNSPAPKFYLAPSCIRVYLHYIKKPC